MHVQDICQGAYEYTQYVARSIALTMHALLLNLIQFHLPQS